MITKVSDISELALTELHLMQARNYVRKKETGARCKPGKKISMYPKAWPTHCWQIRNHAILIAIDTRTIWKPMRLLTTERTTLTTVVSLRLTTDCKCRLLDYECSTCASDVDDKIRTGTEGHEGVACSKFLESVKNGFPKLWEIVA